MHTIFGDMGGWGARHVCVWLGHTIQAGPGRFEWM